MLVPFNFPFSMQPHNGSKVEVGREFAIKKGRYFLRRIEVISSNKVYRA